MTHQRTAFDWCEPRDYYALLMEQGTGKTPIAINDAARRWSRGEIDVALAFAPNGVQTNWTRREIPKHMPDWVPYRAAAWSSGMNKKEERALQELLTGEGELRVVTMNWEALHTEGGVEFLRAFLKSRRVGCFMAGDESHRIKNPKAITTKALMRHVVPKADVRCIMSGTPILNAPWDAFSQFAALHPSILSTESYTVFKSQYAEMLPPDHGVMRHVRMRMEAKLLRQFNGNQERVEEYLAKYTPQLVARDSITGLPRWRNLDKLEALIAPHAYRVLKKDCLDLPEKVYTQRYFRMVIKQRAAYDLLKEELRVRLEDGSLEPVARLAALQKLSQVVSGYVIVPGTTVVEKVIPLEKNPKVAALVEELRDCLEAGEQVIIWARFHEEIADIARVLAEEKITYVEYHGQVTGKARRSQAIDDFESGAAQVFLSNQQAGGTGLTLIAPQSLAAQMSVFYYTNSYSLGDRLQSEDRAHRIGQNKTVRYVDFLAEDSVDDSIVDALRNKQDVAAIVTGDSRRAQLQLLNFQ